MSDLGGHPVEPFCEAAAAKIPTGIEGLDRAIEGLTRGGSILLLGEGGSGKTVFALQFANSACSRGLRTVFISIERRARDLRVQAEASGWDPESHQKRGLLVFVDLAQIQQSRIELAGRKGFASKKGNFTELMRYLPPGMDVLIFDSLDEYARGLSPTEFQDGLGFFIRRLRDRGITALMLMDGDAPAGWKELAMQSVGGVIQLFKWDNPRTGRKERALDIIKMAGAPPPVGALPYELDSGGMAVRRQDDDAAGR